MGDVLPIIAVIAIGVAVFGLMQRRLDQRWEVSWVGFAFVAHIVAPFAQVAVTRDYYGGGDMMMYHRTGTALAGLVRADPGRFFPELVQLILHERPNMPLHLLIGPTGSMCGLSGLVSLATNDSIYAGALVFSMLSFSASWALYVVFRETFPSSLRQQFVVTCMALPSVVFWTSGILKESVAVAGFGWALFGVHRIAGRKGRIGWPAAICGAVLMALVKPYILIAFSAAAGVFFYWRRVAQGGGIRIRPLYLLLFSGITVGAVLSLGELFPRFAFSTLAEETVNLQTGGARVGGGSNYSLGAAEERSLLGQLAYGPFALATTLFRPLPFEVSGVTMALNTVETTLLTGWLVTVLWRRRWAEIWALTTRSPLLMFCVTFILLFGVAVGLASTNLGSLSRYRAPLVPLYASLIPIWHSWRPGPVVRPTSAQPPPRRAPRRRRPAPKHPELT